MVLTDDIKADFSESFKAIFEAQKKIEELKEQTKVYNQTIKETFENIAEKMGIDKKDKDGKKAIAVGYAEYLKSITMPDFMETQDEIFAMLKTYNFLGINSLRD